MPMSSDLKVDIFFREIKGVSLNDELNIVVRKSYEVKKVSFLSDKNEKILRPDMNNISIDASLMGMITIVDTSPYGTDPYS